MQRQLYDTSENVTLWCFHNIALFISAVLVSLWSGSSQSPFLHNHNFCSLSLNVCVQWNRKGAGHVFSANTHQTITADFLDCF